MKSSKYKARILRLDKTTLTDTEIVERALVMSASPCIITDRLNARKTYWMLGRSVDGQRFPTYNKAQREYFRQAIALASKWHPNGLAGLERYGFAVMPVLMRRMAQSQLRKEKGIPRKIGWKWSKEARERLAESRRKSSPAPADGEKRRRGYPPFTLTPGFEIPDTGHRFTVTRETLLEIRAMVFPPGMLD